MLKKIYIVELFAEGKLSLKCEDVNVPIVILIIVFNNSEIIYKNTKITKKTCISPVYKISTCTGYLFFENQNVFIKIFIYTHVM
jgi:hypothetical protein